MSYKLIVRIPDRPPIETQLPAGRLRLGRDPSCEVSVDFAELGGQAAVIECRGDAVFLKNLNRFTIYLGTQPVETGALVEWPPSQQVQLTRNVALSLQPVGESPAEDSSKGSDKNKKARSTLQIGVICVCAIVGYVLLTNGASTVKRRAAPPESFQELIGEFEAGMTIHRTDNRLTGLTVEQQITMRYLQEAWMADCRWGDSRPEKAVAAYELLLSYRPMRAAAMSPETLPGRITQFAKWRLEELSERRR